MKDLSFMSHLCSIVLYEKICMLIFFLPGKKILLYRRSIPRKTLHVVDRSLHFFVWLDDGTE